MAIKGMVMENNLQDNLQVMKKPWVVRHLLICKTFLIRIAWIASTRHKLISIIEGCLD